MTTTNEFRVDDNLTQDESGKIHCAHCHEELGASGDEQYLARALRVSRPPAAAGPQIRVQQGEFVDRAVSFRQLCCPSCGVALVSEIAPDDEVSYRRKSL
jgi:N-methylhydantoinase B